MAEHNKAFSGTISRLAASNREAAVARKKAKDEKDSPDTGGIGEIASKLGAGSDNKKGDKVGGVDTKGLKKKSLLDIGKSSGSMIA